MLQDERVRRQSNDVLEVVRHQNQGNVERPPQAIDFILKAPANGAVHRGKRLIEQQHCGLACECPRQCDSLPFTTRELMRTAGRLLGQMHQREQRLRAAAALGAGAMPERGHHVPERGQMREERVLLKDESHGAAMWGGKDPRLRVRPGVGARLHERVNRSGRGRRSREESSSCRRPTARKSRGPRRGRRRSRRRAASGPTDEV